MVGRVEKSGNISNICVTVPLISISWRPSLDLKSPRTNLVEGFLLEMVRRGEGLDRSKGAVEYPKS